MESIAEIVKNLLVIIIITSFLELLLPEGGIRPFVRFAIGLFIIITVLNPVLAFVFGKSKFEIQWWDTGSWQRQEQQINQAGRTLNKEISGLGWQELKDKVEGQINALVLLVPGVKESSVIVEIDKEGGIKSMDIKVYPEKQRSGEIDEDSGSLNQRRAVDQERAENIKLKINELIKNLYGFDNVKINIVVEGG